MKKLYFIVLTIFFIIWTNTAKATLVTVFEEKFDINSTQNNLNLNYSSFTLNPSDLGAAWVNGGRLLLSPNTTPNANYIGDQIFSIHGYTGYLSITAELGRNDSGSLAGTYVGLMIGGDSFLFHPGYPTGAFRAGGGNIDMGFTPARNITHKMNITVSEGGEFNITITDGYNPLNLFTTSFTDSSYHGGSISLLRGGSDGNGEVFFESLTVQQDDAAPVPEPATMLLFGTGLAGLAAARRRKKVC